MAIKFPVEAWSLFAKAKDKYPSGWAAAITGKLNKAADNAKNLVLDDPAVNIEGKK